MSLRDLAARLPGGTRMFASARLRRDVVDLLNEALRGSGMTQAELARALRKSRSAVNQVLSGDGNLRVDTIAEYLDAMSQELVLSLRRVGPAGAGVGPGGATAPFVELVSTRSSHGQPFAQAPTRFDRRSQFKVIADGRHMAEEVSA